MSKLFPQTPQQLKSSSNNNNLKINKLSLKLNNYTNKESFTTEELKNYIEDEISKYILELTGRKPILKTIIMENSSN